MPRDAYISLTGLAALSGFCDAQNIVSTVGLGRPFDGKFVFYSSLFQAGVDRVVVSEPLRTSFIPELPKNRLHVLRSQEGLNLYRAVEGFFSQYLGAKWFENANHGETRRLAYYIADILTGARLLDVIEAKVKGRSSHFVYDGSALLVGSLRDLLQQLPKCQQATVQNSVAEIRRRIANAKLPE